MPNKIKIKIKDDYFKSERFVKKMLEENKEQLSTVINAMKTFDNYPHMQMTNSDSTSYSPTDNHSLFCHFHQFSYGSRNVLCLQYEGSR